jgi:hypothetical protein
MTGTVTVKRKTLGAAATPRNLSKIPFVFQSQSVGNKVETTSQGGGRSE